LIRLDLKNVEDQYIRDNFRIVESEVRDNLFHNFKGKFYEITVDSAVSSSVFLHKLGFKPLDVITLHVSDSATLTWEYNSFTDTSIYFTTDKACTIRAFIGKYEGERDII